jgi:hypothetical protein
LATSIVAAALTGCGGDDSLDKLAKEKQLSPAETSALKSCASLSKSRRIFVMNGKKKVQFGTLPPEFCACQAPAMASVLKEEGFPENDKVLLALTEDPEKPPLDPLALKEGQTEAGVRSRLESAARSCLVKAKAEFKKKTQEKARNKDKKPG